MIMMSFITITFQNEKRIVIPLVDYSHDTVVSNTKAYVQHACLYANTGTAILY